MRPASVAHHNSVSSEGKLGKWCEIIANCKPLIEKNYYPWSYICTGTIEELQPKRSILSTLVQVLAKLFTSWID